MSIAIGIHAGLYVLIMTDTRASYYPPGRAPYHRDNTEKSIRTSAGIMTGTGFIPLLDAVKVRLADEDPGDTTRITEFCVEEQGRLLRQTTDQRYVEAITRGTGWMFTYLAYPIGRPEEELVMDDVNLRLAMAHATDAFDVVILTTGSCPVMFSDLVPETSRDLLGVPLADIRTCEDDETLAR